MLKSSRLPLYSALSILAFGATSYAHLSYSGREFGNFSGVDGKSVTIGTQTVVNWSWADGTDADFMHTHKMKFFSFTLENSGTVTISVQSLDIENLLPGFSLYSGLAHMSPALPDYESSATLAYLATLSGPEKEGAFNALDTWKMGNDASTGPADFSTFTYVGHAADGTSLNYGPSDGINGDGNADGRVTSSFNLPAGSYTLAVGGAVYGGQGSVGAKFEGGYTNANNTAYPMAVTVSAVPEPSAFALIGSGAFVFGLMRRRRAGV